MHQCRSLEGCGGQLSLHARLFPSLPLRVVGFFGGILLTAICQLLSSVSFVWENLETADERRFACEGRSGRHLQRLLS